MPSSSVESSCNTFNRDVEEQLALNNHLIAQPLLQNLHNVHFFTPQTSLDNPPDPLLLPRGRHNPRPHSPAAPNRLPPHRANNTFSPRLLHPRSRSRIQSQPAPKNPPHLSPPPATLSKNHPHSLPLQRHLDQTPCLRTRRLRRPHLPRRRHHHLPKHRRRLLNPPPQPRLDRRQPRLRLQPRPRLLGPLRLDRRKLRLHAPLPPERSAGPNTRAALLKPHGQTHPPLPQLRHVSLPPLPRALGRHARRIQYDAAAADLPIPRPRLPGPLLPRPLDAARVAVQRAQDDALLA